MFTQLTLDSNTRWYIDSIKTKEDSYEIEGWIYNSTGVITNIYVGSIELQHFERIHRPDVIQAINIIERHPYGIKFILPKSLRNSDVSIKVNGNVYVLGTLLKWIAFYSEFNRDHKDLIVVDNFYKDPDLIREFAMKEISFEPSDYHKGERSRDKFWLNGTKEKFEQIIGRKVTNWNHPNYANGVFQYCTAQDPIVYHVDTQTYAAMVFLTPNAPVETGTAFYKSKITGDTEYSGNFNQDNFKKTFTGISKDMNFYDSTQYELMDEVANVYNRLVLFNAKRIHAATKYFGDAIDNARFFQLFFFDVE